MNPAVTLRQALLIHRSWQQVLPIQAAAADLFYKRLFTLRPDLRNLFRNDLSRQGSMLIAALNAVVHSIEDPAPLLPMVQRMAQRHVHYGVLPEHYDVVGEALLWTLREGLGSAATPETLEAWAAAYAFLAGAMKEAAYPALADAAG